jgi:hypothetical protein
MIEIVPPSRKGLCGLLRAKMSYKLIVDYGMKIRLL